MELLTTQNTSYTETDKNSTPKAGKLILHKKLFEHGRIEISRHETASMSTFKTGDSPAVPLPVHTGVQLQEGRLRKHCICCDSRREKQIHLLTALARPLSLRDGSRLACNASNDCVNASASCKISDR